MAGTFCAFLHHTVLIFFRYKLREFIQNGIYGKRQKLPLALISFPYKPTQKYRKKSPIHSQYTPRHDRARALSKVLGTGCVTSLSILTHNKSEQEKI